MLKVIRKQPNISISEIAKKTSLSVSTVTGILVRLENRKYIQRSKSEDDKRRIIIKLTPTGKEFMEKAPQPFQNTFLSAFKQLEQWEKLMILSSLKRLVTLMVAEDIDALPILSTDIIEYSGDKKSDQLEEAL